MKRRSRQSSLPAPHLPAGAGHSSGTSISDPGVTAETLDTEQIDQLHAATLQVSSNCFELKKLCATVLVAAGTLIAVLSDGELNQAIFVGGLVVVVVFWSADAQSYYIQVKLRARMKELLRDRINRSPGLSSYGADGVGLPIESQRARWRRVLHAFFNASMLYYFLIAAVVFAAWVAYAGGLFG